MTIKTLSINIQGATRPFRQIMIPFSSSWGFEVGSAGAVSLVEEISNADASDVVHFEQSWSSLMKEEK